MNRGERAYDENWLAEGQEGGERAIDRYAIAGSRGRGWFPRVAFNHPEAMNILFDGQFR